MNHWKEHYKTSTCYESRQSLKRLLQFVDRIHGTRHADAIPRVLRPIPRTKTCTDDDYAKVLNASPLWFRFFLTLCRECGLRHQEAANIRPQDLDQETNSLVFKRKLGGTSHIPVSPDVVRAIQHAAQVSNSQPVIVTLGAKNTEPYLINWTWTKVRKKAGIDAGIIIHDLRRTAATRLYSLTKDLRLTQQLLGHRNMSSTLHYIGTADPENLRDLLPRIAPQNLRAMKPATEVKQ